MAILVCRWACLAPLLAPLLSNFKRLPGQTLRFLKRFPRQRFPDLVQKRG
jgi:hypothetical protein